MDLETILSNGTKNMIGKRAYRNIMVDNPKRTDTGEHFTRGDGF
jgi:hypothetical protein